MAACRRPSLIGADKFIFLGVTGSVRHVGWDGAEREKLWRYNQHYFDDLNATGATERGAWHKALLLDWIKNATPTEGNAWEPYPTSLRIVNWIKWSLAGNSLPDVCLASLAAQARWLMKRLEVHLLGNHLFVNAKALIFAGLFFKGAEAEQWLSAGFRILARQVPEQILADGGHFERSTMYHALALEDMLDLCNVGASYFEELSQDQKQDLLRWRQQTPSMLSWLQIMCHPDQEISFFNDAAHGIAPTLTELENYAARLGLKSHSVPTLASGSVRAIPLLSSGYVRLESLTAAAILDVALLGPDYLPGHAHADTLSFELSVFGHRTIINTGVSCYGQSAQRLRQRGTAAHSTVEIDGENSSEVWSGFRVARRARPFGLQITPQYDLIEVICSHDGYCRLKGCPVHQRRWRLSARELYVEDMITDPSKVAIARFHLHHELRVTQEEGQMHGMIFLPDGQQVAWRAECSRVMIETGEYCQEFGACRKNSCLALQLDMGKANLRLTW